MVSQQFSPEFRRIVSEQATIQLIAGGFIFTEGPVWNGQTGSLAWTDIIGDTIWKWVPGEGKSVVMTPTIHANGMTYDREGRLIVAGWSSRSVWRMDNDGSTTTLCSHYEGKKLNTPNDIVVKSDGTIYFTDPSGGLNLVGHQGHDLQKQIEFEGVYRFNPADSSLTLLEDNMVGPNGLCFSPDESLLYVNDSRERYIRVYDVKLDGTIHNGHTFIEMSGADLGNPDGMKVDAEGNVYCTGPGGVWIIDPEGKPLGRIRIPEQCANFALGVADWSSLYFTARSSVYGMKLDVPVVPVYPGT